jgi:hypothetical protein
VCIRLVVEEVCTCAMPHKFLLASSPYLHILLQHIRAIR